MIALIVMTDGRRDCITQTMAALEANLVGPITRRIMHDDSGDPDHRDWLFNAYPNYEPWWSEQRLGFAGAYRSTWESLRFVPEPLIFSIEDDMVINRPVDVAAMAAVLDANPHLVQMALRRQPWNPVEVAAGGVVEVNPASYQEQTNGTDVWLEHRLFFSTNCSLYRRGLIMDRDWPDGADSEGRFGIDLFQDPVVRAGYWGSWDSGEWINHIGTQRAGHGY